MALTDWEMIDNDVRSVVRDTFGSPVTYTPKNGSAVSLIDEGLSTERPLLGEYTPLYEDVSASANGFPASGPRIEFVLADLIACGIAPSKEGDTITLSVRGVSRTYNVVDLIEADVGSIYLMLGERR